MTLTLRRFYFAEKYTIGRLYTNGKYFCDTLEDTNRDKNKDGDLKDAGEGKVYGITCIPFGTYDVEVTLSSRFKRMLPLLLNVPEFDGIRIHSGNTAEDTLGCILVGKNTEKGIVTGSRVLSNELTDLLLTDQKKHIKNSIQIV